MPYIGNPAVVGDSTNNFKLLDDIQSFTVTFDATDTSIVSISGDTLTFRNHRFLTGQRVTYNDGGGTAIGGLADGVYFIIKVDPNTIQLATNASNAASSTAINLTSGAAGGSHTLNVAFDGVNTKFSATHSNGTRAGVSRAGQISLSINGVIQQPQDTGSPTVGYGVLPDSVIIFSTPPSSVDKVFGTFIGETAPSFDIDDNTIDNFTGNGSTTSYNLSKDVPSNHDILVTLDGVTQHPTDSSTVRAYSVIESTLTFTSAPDDGVAIQVRHIGFAGATSSAVTGFYGRQGNVALKSTDDISVQNVSAGIITATKFVGVNSMTDLFVSGITSFTNATDSTSSTTGSVIVSGGVGIAGSLNVGGSVSVGGTLTYEDVTNIDSVGIITARSNILVGSGITLSPDGDVFVTGISTFSEGIADDITINSVTVGKGANSVTQNTVLGESALDAATTGGYNVAVGYEALTTNTTGAQNTAVGRVALQLNTTGNNNVAIGRNALQANTTAADNTAVGTDALKSNTTGGSNTAVGRYGLVNNTTASNNTALGYNSLNANTTGDQNTAVGNNALDANTTADQNTAVGSNALGANTTGQFNCALGVGALQNNTTASNNTAIGINALLANTTGTELVALGGYALDANTTASNNTAIGYESLGANTTGAENTGVGRRSLQLNTTASYNTACGASALQSNTTGAQNTAVGRSAMTANTTGASNTALGYNALDANTTASYNTAVGWVSLGANTTGTENTAVGRNSLESNTTGSNNTAVGAMALDDNNANSNTAVGYKALNLNTTGTQSVAVGMEASKATTTGSYNTAVGGYTLHDNTTGSNNVAVGDHALHSYTGGNNTAVGINAARLNTGSNQVAIGYNAMTANTTGAASVCIGYEAGKNQNCNYSTIIGDRANGDGALTGDHCTYIGHYAGYDATTSTRNTAIGSNCASNVTTANDCTMIGYNAGANVTTGSNTTVLGSYALDSSTVTDSENTIIGAYTGRSITGGQNTILGNWAATYVTPLTTGEQNVFLGAYCRASSGSVTNAAIISYNGTDKGGNTFFASYASSYNGANSSTWSTTSDIRIKKNVVDNTTGLDKINQIRVRNFEYRTVDEIVDFENPKAVVVNKEGQQLGVIAQEIQEILPDVVKQESTGSLSVNPDNLTWYLVNAVKELSAKVEELESKLN